MEGESRVGLDVVPETVVDHALDSAHRLIGRLEEKCNVAGDFSLVMAEDLGRRCDNRGVDVVAAAVIPAGVLRCVGRPSGLIHINRVHFGAEQDGLAGIGALEEPEHAGAADALGHLETEGAKFASESRGSPGLFKGEFRVGVEVAAQLDQLVPDGGNVLPDIGCGAHVLVPFGWRI